MEGGDEGGDRPKRFRSLRKSEALDMGWDDDDEPAPKRPKTHLEQVREVAGNLPEISPAHFGIAGGIPMGGSQGLGGAFEPPRLPAVPPTTRSYPWFTAVARFGGEPEGQKPPEESDSALTDYPHEASGFKDEWEEDTYGEGRDKKPPAE
jgi:hypothetical protein